MAEEKTEIAAADAPTNDAKAGAEKAESATETKSAAKPKKRRSSYSTSAHPPCIDMLIESISNLADKNGSSFQAIKRYISENFDCEVDSKLMPHIKKALKSGVASGKLIQTKGKGASGSFKIGEAAQTLMSKPTKRQVASAEAAAKRAVKEQKAAKRAAQLAKRKKHVIVQAPASRTSSKKSKSKAKSKKSSVKKPAAKKAAKKTSAKKSKGKAKKGRGRKGKK